jgi:hypothetical protein
MGVLALTGFAEKVQRPIFDYSIMIVVAQTVIIPVPPVCDRGFPYPGI